MSQVYGQIGLGLKWHRQSERYRGWSRCGSVRLLTNSLTDVRPSEKDICRKCEPVKEESWMSQVYGQMGLGLKWHLRSAYYRGYARCGAWLAMESLTETRPPQEDICQRCEPVKKET